MISGEMAGERSKKGTKQGKRRLPENPKKNTASVEDGSKVAEQV